MNPLARRFLVLALASALTPALAACVSRGTHPPSGYLASTSGMNDSQRDDKFKQEWVAEGERGKLIRFKKVQVRPLNLDYLSEKSKHKPEDLKKLQASFKKSFEGRLGKTHTLVPTSGMADSDTVVLEPALVMIYQPNRLLNLLTTILVGPITSGGAAFEARLVDGASKDSVAKIAEEQKGAWHLGSLTIGGYMKYYDTEKVFGAWAKRLDAWLTSEEEE